MKFHKDLYSDRRFLTSEVLRKGDHMDKRKLAGTLGFLVYGGATLGLAAGEIKDPKQVNDLGKGLLSIAQVASTATTSVSDFIHFVPNMTAPGQFDATPWEQVEEVVTNPGFRVYQTT